jgi:hypothetical protein
MRYGEGGGGSSNREGVVSSNDALIAIAICVSSSSWICACLSASLGSPGAELLNTRDTLSTFGSMLLKTRRARVEGVALEGVAATPREPPVVRGVMSAEKSPSRPDTDVPVPVASPSASAAPVSEGASRSSPYSPSSRAATSEARGLNALLNELRIQLDIAASGASGTPELADAARDDSGPPEGHRARISSRNRGHRRGTRHHSS